MADLLIERTQNTSWVVTFKSLITIHHLMCYGNEVSVKFCRDFFKKCITLYFNKFSFLRVCGAITCCSDLANIWPHIIASSF